MDYTGVNVGSYIAALNIIYDGKILNLDRFPLLIYCNGKKTLDDELKNDKFKEYVKKIGIFDDICMLINSEITYCIYGDEYSYGKIRILDLWTIDNMPFDNIIKAICTTVRNICEIDTGDISNMQELYGALNSRYGISKETLINLIRYIFKNMTDVDTYENKMNELLFNLSKTF